MLARADKTRDAFYGANLRALTEVVTQLNRWRDGGAHDTSVRSVVKQFDGVCAKLPAGDPQAATCAALIQPVKACRRAGRVPRGFGYWPDSDDAPCALP